MWYVNDNDSAYGDGWPGVPKSVSVVALTNGIAGYYYSCVNVFAENTGYATIKNSCSNGGKHSMSPIS